jgi:uncharacterized membrane protein (UPF0136 family)
MGVACLGGGITGYLKTGSRPSLVAGVAVGILYLWSGAVALNGDPRGYYGAAGKPSHGFIFMVTEVIDIYYRSICYSVLVLTSSSRKGSSASSTHCAVCSHWSILLSNRTRSANGSILNFCKAISQSDLTVLA